MKIIKDIDGESFFCSNKIEDFIALDNYFKLIGQEFYWGGYSPGDKEFPDFVHKDNYVRATIAPKISTTYLIYIYSRIPENDLDGIEELSKVEEFVKIYGEKK